MSDDKELEERLARLCSSIQVPVLSEQDLRERYEALKGPKTQPSLSLEELNVRLSKLNGESPAVSGRVVAKNGPGIRAHASDVDDIDALLEEVGDECRLDRTHSRAAAAGGSRETPSTEGKKISAVGIEAEKYQRPNVSKKGGQDDREVDAFMSKMLEQVHSQKKAVSMNKPSGQNVSSANGSNFNSNKSDDDKSDVEEDEDDDAAVAAIMQQARDYALFDD